jgi:hypothetical protein
MKKERGQKAMGEIEYAVREHEVTNEEHVVQGTVMYTVYGKNGPWHDMVTGPADYCWEIVDALQFVEEIKREERQVYAEDNTDRVRRNPPKTAHVQTTKTGSVIYYKS